MGEGQSNNHGDRDAPVKVGMISLGCAKNLVDGEIMLGKLESAGVELTADATRADVVVVNTCGFITDAKKESIDAILEVARAKQGGDVRRLVVAGCMAQAYADDLLREIPEIDAFVGLDELESITAAVRGEIAAHIPDQHSYRVGVDIRKIIEVTSHDLGRLGHAEDLETRVVRRPVADQKALLDRPRRLDVLLDALFLQDSAVITGIVQRQPRAVARCRRQQRIVDGVLVVGDVGVHVEDPEDIVLGADRHAQDRRQFERSDADAGVHRSIGQSRLDVHGLPITEDAVCHALADLDLVDIRRPGLTVHDRVHPPANSARLQLAVGPGEEDRAAVGVDGFGRGFEDSIDQITWVEVRGQGIHQRVGGLEHPLRGR